MKTKVFLEKHDACRRGAYWALSVSEDMADVWDAMIAQKKWDWLVWTATQPGLFSDAVQRKLACRFVRETPVPTGGLFWDLLMDERSRRAVETAERFADGKATKKELKAAADAAASAALGPANTAIVAIITVSTKVYRYVGPFHFYDHALPIADLNSRTTAIEVYDIAKVASLDTTDCLHTAVLAGRNAYNTARAAHGGMIAELGNPFKKES